MVRRTFWVLGDKLNVTVHEEFSSESFSHVYDPFIKELEKLGKVENVIIHFKLWKRQQLYISQY